MSRYLIDKNNSQISEYFSLMMQPTLKQQLMGFPYSGVFHSRYISILLNTVRDGFVRYHFSLIGFFIESSFLKMTNSEIHIHVTLPSKFFNEHYISCPRV